MPVISATQSVTEIRPSDYGTYLRLPADLVPRQRSLGNNLGDVAVDTIELPNCVGGGPSATFSLKSDDICRFHLLSGGAYLFTSAAPSSVFQTALGSDNFNRANESPATGWTAVSSTVSNLQVSANKGVGVSSNAGVNMAYFSTASITSYQEVQTDYVVSAQGDRVGVTAMTSAGPSSYMLVAQKGAVNSTLTIYKKIGAAIGTDLGTMKNTPGTSAGTMKLIASADATTTTLSAFHDGAYAGFANDTLASRMSSGYPGAYYQTEATSHVASGSYLDNWQSLQVTGAPYSQPDIVLGASADGWVQRGQTEAARWAQFYYQDLRLGVDSSLTVTGAVSAVLSAGVSAYLPTTTYGVVQTRVSSVSSTNLGAGHSTSNGLIVVIEDTSAIAWYVSGVRVSAAGAVF